MKVYKTMLVCDICGAVLSRSNNPIILAKHKKNNRQCKKIAGLLAEIAELKTSNGSENKDPLLEVKISGLQAKLASAEKQLKLSQQKSLGLEKQLSGSQKVSLSLKECQKRCAELEKKVKESGSSSALEECQKKCAKLTKDLTNAKLNSAFGSAGQNKESEEKIAKLESENKKLEASLERYQESNKKLKVLLERARA